MSDTDKPINGNDPDMPKPPTVPIPKPKGRLRRVDELDVLLRQFCGLLPP